MLRTLVLAAALVGAASPSYADIILGVTNDNRFVRFDGAGGRRVGNLGIVTGLQPGETIIAIDRRPAVTRNLARNSIYGVTDQNRLYRIRFTGGAPLATQIGSDGQFTQDTITIGFDFNPIPDRIRVVEPTNRNARLNPNTGGLVMIDGSLKFDDTTDDGDAIDPNAGTDPNVVATAYTNSFAPSPRTPPPGTVQYVIDSSLDILAIQNPPNAGILNTVGALGVDVGNFVSLDISGLSDITYMLEPDGGLTPSSVGIAAAGDPNSLYVIDRATGAATFIRNVNAGRILGITVSSVPAPASLALFGLGAVGFALTRRR